MSFRLKCPDLHWCLATPTDLLCFVASQPIIKFTHIHEQFLLKKLLLADKKYFVEPWPAQQQLPPAGSFTCRADVPISRALRKSTGLAT